MSEEYQGGVMSEEYEEVTDRSNKLVMRLEAFEAAEVDEIEMRWLIGEVCHLRGAYIINAFRLRDEHARAEKAEAELVRIKTLVRRVVDGADARDLLSCAALDDEPEEQTP